MPNVMYFTFYMSTQDYVSMLFESQHSDGYKYLQVFATSL